MGPRPTTSSGRPGPIAATGKQPEPGSFLASLSEEDVKALSRRGVRRSYERGTPLLHEWQPPDSVIVLLRGRVKIYNLEEGRETVLDYRGPGELLGEVSALDGEPRSATVTAVEPVEALVVATSEFRSYLKERPAVALLLLRTLARRLRDADRARAQFGAYDTIGRVSSRLVELCDRYGEPGSEGIEIDLPFTQDELAAWTGSSREAVQKALHALRDCGWVKTERRRIVVLDLEALRRPWA